MKLEMFQKVSLKNGQIGCIIEIFNDGEAYMIEVLENDGNYSQLTIYPHQIKSIFVEVEKSVETLL